ncbi:MAG: UDP-N-acetylmuramate--L-alanine ligase [Bacteroidales bacterium]|nr:UDP-N-acetylmuramate--L-alanine ligase [Clostridium sp.]MCM1203661.1 UDP-N-acetylmuramate--L-alanine ligase [Bacteroidales bacterium]
MYQIDFNNPIHVHFIGIGGISMSGLAEILLKEHFHISGSDAKSSDIVDNLIAMGAIVNIGQCAENITDDIDLVVYTAAVHEDNPEFAACLEKQLPMLTRAQLLGQIMNNYPYSVAVSGTHGKTTTTSMLSQVFLEADMDPTVSVGGILDSIGGNVRVGKSDYFVTEACEYTNSYHAFFPYISIILNVDADHLDFFSGIDEIIESFHTFAANLSEAGTLVVNGDMDCLPRITRELPCSIVTFGLESHNRYCPADITADENGHMDYTLTVDGVSCERVHLNIGGMHNVANSLAVIAVADLLGIDREHSLAGLACFGGAHRRFEQKGTLGNVTVIDDYAHHPTEIRATLSSASHTPHHELWVVFQPHTYTRTHALFDEFADALKGFDHVILVDIYAAREADTGLVHARELADKIKELGTDARYFSSFAAVENYLLRNCKKNDLLITMGAGDVYLIGEELLGK